MIREDDPFMVLDFHVRLSHQNNLHIIIILILYSFLKSTQSSVCFLCFLENLKDTYYRVGNLNFSSLALWASDIQIVLTRICFHSPNTPSPPPPPPPKKKKVQETTLLLLLIVFSWCFSLLQALF